MLDAQVAGAPDAEVGAVQAVLREAGMSSDPSQWEVHAGGSAHVVVNVGHVISVRIAKNATVCEHVQRRTEVLRRLPRFSFATPRPLTGVVVSHGYTGVGLTWLPGHPHPPGHGDPAVLHRVLTELVPAGAPGRWRIRAGATRLRTATAPRRGSGASSTSQVQSRRPSLTRKKVRKATSTMPARKPLVMKVLLPLIT